MLRLAMLGGFAAAACGGPLAAAAEAGRGPGDDPSYCNPMDLNYGFVPHERFAVKGKHRTTADPVIVPFEGDYYLFSTNQQGYWWSADLVSWTFVPRRFFTKFEDGREDIVAPAAWVQDGALHVVGSSHQKDMPIWRSRSPRTDTWELAVEASEAAAWDPGYFVDDDGRVFLYWGSSNTLPLYGVEVEPSTLRPAGERVELIRARPERHGWERFGEYHDNVFLAPFVEGPWMNKIGGRYYLQYGAPGTEFSGYADGVYVGDAPLGTFEYQAHNPFASKLGGFARGAGHGATFADRHGNLWHVGTIAISVKNNFERRIGLWRAGVDADGVLFCDTAYGDFPHAVPDRPLGPGETTFTGWMLLNYAGPVRASSTLGGFAPNFAVDERITTYWSAETGGPGEWFETDLGAEATVRAVQVNFADQDAEIRGRAEGLRHRFRLLASGDGSSWRVIADRSASEADTPHAYIELDEPSRARFVRIENVETPTGRFALSGLRVFGQDDGPVPGPVEHFDVLRGASEPRAAWIRWAASPDATGYVLYSGVSPDKLYTAIRVMGESQYFYRLMTADRAYWFAIEAFNGAGVGPRTEPVLSRVPTRE